MNYKYGIAIFLGLLLASISMSKVASAALIKYEIAAYTENYGSNFFDVSFRGTVILDSTLAASGVVYSVEESGFSDYSVKYWLDEEEYRYSSILGISPDIGLNFRLMVIFNPDNSWSYAQFSGGVSNGDFRSSFDVITGCRGPEALLRDEAYCEDYVSSTVTVQPSNGGFGKRDLMWSVVDDYEGAVNGPVLLVPEPYTVSIFVLGIIGLATRRFIKQS